LQGDPNPGGAPLRIAHLTATFPPYPGGAGNTAFRFATGQAERGHHVEVFTATAEGEPPDPGEAIVHRLEPLAAIGNAPLIPSLVRLEGFDVVHLHYPFIFGSELALLGRLRRRAREQALVVHYKNRLVSSGPRGAAFETYEHTVAPALIGAADRVLVLSGDHARSVSYLRRSMERHPEKMIEMPNGVDGEVFSPGPGGEAVRERLGIADGAVVAAFVATLDRAHHFKRLDIAIDAVAEVDHDLHLVVAGGGELEGEFREPARARGVGERVHFLGSVPHAELPAESFGIVLIEAMATGLPVIASEYPGVRAVVNEGETGMLVPRGDVGAVAGALMEMLEVGSAGREAFGVAGREKALREWSWSVLLDRMDEAYGEAIKARLSKMGR
jgi:glycosyltransferase involved in cell wall biosynthesis